MLPQYAGSADHLNLNTSYQMAAASLLSRSMHGLELSSQQHNANGLPSYRPSPDYDMVMRERTMHAHAYMPEAYNQQQTVRELQNGITADPRFVMHSVNLSHSDIWLVTRYNWIVMFSFPLVQVPYHCPG